MPRCEMCGKEASLMNAEVEGVELKVCPACAKHGTVKYTPRQWGGSAYRSRPAVKAEQPEEEVISNYASAIRSVREKLSMTQEQFAKYLSERESILAKWESGSIAPSLDLAKKLEKKLGITLVKKPEIEDGPQEKRKQVSDTMTLGDFIKVRSRKA